MKLEAVQHRVLRLLLVIPHDLEVGEGHNSRRVGGPQQQIMRLVGEHFLPVKVDGWIDGWEYYITVLMDCVSVSNQS